MDINKFCSLGEFIIVEEKDINSGGLITVSDDSEDFKEGIAIIPFGDILKKGSSVIYVASNAKPLGLGYSEKYMVVENKDIVAFANE